MILKRLRHNHHHNNKRGFEENLCTEGENDDGRDA